MNELGLSLAFFSTTAAILASLTIFLSRLVFLSFEKEGLLFLINAELLVFSSTASNPAFSSDCLMASVLTSTAGSLVTTFSFVTFTRVEADEEDGRLYLQHLWKEKSLQLNFSLRQKGGIFCSVVVVVVVVVVVSVVATEVVLFSAVDSICNETNHKN